MNKNLAAQKAPATRPPAEEFCAPCGCYHAPQQYGAGATWIHFFCGSCGLVHGRGEYCPADDDGSAEAYERAKARRDLGLERARRSVLEELAARERETAVRKRVITDLDRARASKALRSHGIHPRGR